MADLPDTSSRSAAQRYAALAARRIGAAAVFAGLVGSACINSSVPLAPECTPAIGIELSSQDVKVGDEFVATATHRGDECLSNLMWTAGGPMTLRVAEGNSATFRADDSGTGTIRVQNDKGSLGILEVEIQEGEEDEGS